MVHKKHKHLIGGITVGDIRKILRNRDSDDLVYLDGFDFYACETYSGNIEFSAKECKGQKELW